MLQVVLLLFSTDRSGVRQSFHTAASNGHDDDDDGSQCGVLLDW